MYTVYVCMCIYVVGNYAFGFFLLWNISIDLFTIFFLKLFICFFSFPYMNLIILFEGCLISTSTIIVQEDEGYGNVHQLGWYVRSCILGTHKQLVAFSLRIDSICFTLILLVLPHFFHKLVDTYLTNRSIFAATFS